MITRQNVETLIDSLPPGILPFAIDSTRLEELAQHLKASYRALFDDPRFKDVHPNHVARTVALEIVDLELREKTRHEDDVRIGERDRVIDLYFSAQKGDVESRRAYEQHCMDLIDHACFTAHRNQTEGVEFDLSLIDTGGLNDIGDLNHAFGDASGYQNPYQQKQELIKAFLPVLMILRDDFVMPELQVEIPTYDFSQPLGFSEEEFHEFIGGDPATLKSFLHEYDFSFYEGENKDVVLSRARAAVALEAIAGDIDVISGMNYVSPAEGSHNHADAMANSIRGFGGPKAFRMTALQLIQDIEEQFKELASTSHAALVDFVQRNGLDQNPNATAYVSSEDQDHLHAYGVSEEYLGYLARLRVALGLPEQTQKLDALPAPIKSRERQFVMDGDGFLVPKHEGNQ